FFISSHEWLAFKLGAEKVTVLPSASYEPYYWNDEQCRLFGLDIKKFPPFVKTGMPIGNVSHNAASWCKLKSGTPVIAGAPDFISALIGTGIQKPGDVCDRTGSSEGINVCATEAIKGEGLRALPHVKEGLWNIGAVINSSGRLFEWYMKQYSIQDNTYEELMAELIPSTTDTELFEGEFFLPPDDLSGEKPAPGRPALGRAVLCAIGFAVRGVVEILGKAGLPVKLMRVSGGQGKNPRWNRLKADITGVSLMIPEISDGELAGNAIIAASALEEISPESASDRMIRFREVYEPHAETASFWEQRYRLYKQRAEERQASDNRAGRFSG
ncbi:MAG: sugar kinase, partial [Treponema sp.]|nr:sugar kinase [Treponema sp.]